MAIYVEILIHASLDELWRRTQTPELHERWDLRFTKIEYLPKAEVAAPQRFLYETRIGLGIAIQGAGESVASHEADGKRTSSLRFWSDDPKSLIKQGAGYWQYEPTPDGIRFLTSYDYGVRFGMAGRAFDGLIFRPLMGWATAWSFDRLRLWLEKGIDPAVSRERALLHAIATWLVAVVWFYQGAVPKLFMYDVTELALLIDAGIPTQLVSPALGAIGAGEVVLGAATLLLNRRRSVFGLTLALMLMATLAVAWNSPHTLTAAFNPLTLNLLMAGMALVGWLTCVNLPSARRCKRRRDAAA
jgi:hypothetical protein